MKKSRQKLKKTYLHELNKSQTSQGEQKHLLSFPHDQGVQEACGKWGHTTIKYSCYQSKILSNIFTYDTVK